MFSSKMFLMQKIVFQLFFIIFLMLGDFVIADGPYNFTMLKQCKNFEKKTMQGVAFFSSTEFWQFQIPTSSDYYFDSGDPTWIRYEFLGRNTTSIEPFEHLFLTCHCSNTTEDYFFFPTSLKVDGNVSNGVALCVQTHEKNCAKREWYSCKEIEKYYKNIPGIEDSKDLYDLMSYKYSTILPRNIMSSNDSSDNSSMGCVDIYGKPTHSFDGIQSCLVQYLYNGKGDNYVYKYSGPLLYGNLDWIPDDFFDSINTSVHYKVEKPNLGYCKYHENGTLYSFTCICHGENQDTCKIKSNKRICAYDMKTPTTDYISVWKDKWFSERCGYFFISTSTSAINVSIEGDSIYSLHPELSDKKCNQYSAEEWCSKVGARTNFYETFKACCDYGDFCNIINVNFLKNQIDNFTTTGLTCTYSAKGQAVFYKYCELYYDLISKNMVVLNPYVSEEIHNSTAPTASCYYVIAKINVTDDINCTTRLYTETDALHFFYKCRCKTSNCDGDDEEMAVEMNNNVFTDEFYCQYLNFQSKSDYKKFESHVLESIGKETGAICFIEISLIDDNYSIKAESIKDNYTLSAKKICKNFSYSPDSSYNISTGYSSCCTAILQQPQSASNCTIENMLKELQHEIKNDDIRKQLTGQKGTLKCGKNDCLISDGCFETRELALDQKKEEDVVEEEITSSSLECVNKIEENVISEAPISSIWNPDYGYVCKLMEAKDRCTVVHPQDSNLKPLIVCCCNEGYKVLLASDGTFKCPSKVGKLPSEIGKRIGSFH